MSSRTVYFTTCPFRFASSTSASGANSHKIWRHAPQGGVGGGPGREIILLPALAAGPGQVVEVALQGRLIKYVARLGKDACPDGVGRNTAIPGDVDFRDNIGLC